LLSAVPVARAPLNSDRTTSTQRGRRLLWSVKQKYVMQIVAGLTCSCWSAMSRQSIIENRRLLAAVSQWEPGEDMIRP
jgi:catalase (peroxidase I)